MTITFRPGNGYRVRFGCLGKELTGVIRSTDHLGFGLGWIMTLRQRTLLSVALTLACLVAGTTLVSSRILMRKYEELERRETLRNLNRVTDELDYQLKEMHAHASDWSNWDDTYRFMKDQNQSYVASNLGSITLNLDLMAFIDLDGRIINETPIPRPGHKAPPKASDLRTALGFQRPASERPKLDTNFAGIVRLANGDTLLVSMRPILKTGSAGPSRGWTVFALRLDQVEMARLASRLHLNLTQFGLDDPSMTPSCREEVAILRNGPRADSRPLNSHTIAGYVLLKDYQGKPVKLLRSTDSRDIYREGLSSQRTLIQTAGIAGLIFSIMVLWIVEVAALRRVSRLRVQVQRVSAEGGDASSVELAGKDELSWLARVISSLITKQREARDELSLKNDNLQHMVDELAATNHILENAVEGIAEVDAEGRIVATNTAFATTYEYESDRMPGFHWMTLVAPEDHERVQQAIDLVTQKGKAHCEVQGRRRDGSLFHKEVVIVTSRKAEAKALSFHWFVRDISERKKLESEIQYQAFHDPLTGLPNRALFVDRLDMACKRASRKQEGVGVLFLDLDDFKLINDTMGHDAGDHLLAAVASRIQRCIRPQDTAARLGGDEFTVLLDGLTSVEEAIHVAERILAGLEAPISLPTGKTFGSASIGIAFCENGDSDSDTLLHDADVAMYQAKCMPMPTYAVFEPSMNNPAVERRELATALKAALDQDQLSLHYQPIVDVESGDTVGMEALLRWRDPVRGDVPPNMFVAVAEEAGLMEMLGTWSLRHACLQMSQWLAEVPEAKNLVMSVNLSGKQLQRQDINDTILSILEETGLPAEKLRLEVAAKVLPSDGERTVSLLNRLKSTGVKLAIDDFGTGSHLISRLSEYPFDMVKIDGSVTWMLETHEEARALVQAIMLMAKPAGVEVTAEGIETAAQLKYLKRAGCRNGQGYIFGKALPAGEAMSAITRKLLPNTEISPDFAA